MAPNIFTAVGIVRRSFDALRLLRMTGAVGSKEGRVLTLPYGIEFKIILCNYAPLHSDPVEAFAVFGGDSVDFFHRNATDLG